MQINKIYLYNAIGLSVMAAGVLAFIAVESKRPPEAKKAAVEAPGLNKPRGLDVGPQGIVLADSRNHRIEIRSTAGITTRRFGSMGRNESQFKEPCDVALDASGNIFVADTFYSSSPDWGLPWGRVQKFSPDGLFVTSFGKIPGAGGDLFGPRSIAINSKGEVFLSDTGNHRVIKYRNDGTFVKKIGTKGKALGQFIEPFGLAVDGDDNLYVADRLNFRVQVFNADLLPLRQFKVDGWAQQQIDMEPYLAIDKKQGRIYISDPLNNKIYSHNLNGGDRKVITQAGGTALIRPTGLAFDETRGVLLVTDGGNRILTFKP